MSFCVLHGKTQNKLQGILTFTDVHYGWDWSLILSTTKFSTLKNAIAYVNQAPLTDDKKYQEIITTRKIFPFHIAGKIDLTDLSIVKATHEDFVELF